MTKQNGNDKRYYSISEVARMTSLEPYVLRYWEKEFAMLHPRKNRGGNRLYTTGDIELINRINHLRKQEKLTIEGTRAKLTMRRGAEQKATLASVARAKTIIGKLRKDVEDLLKHFS